MACFGSIGGGWLSGSFISKGWPIFKARKVSMLVFALCVVPIVGIQALGKMDPWLAILIIGLAAAAHQAWSATVFTVSSDMFPKKAVASVVGLGGMAGAFGAVLFQKCSGNLLDHYKGNGHVETAYYTLFIVAGFVYGIAWIIFHILASSMQPVDFSEQ